MRIAKSIFVGSLAALVLVAAPALAKNSDSQKTEDKQASASCQAYQPAEEHRARHRSASAVSPTCADQCRGGEWVVLLCKRSEHTLPYALEARNNNSLAGAEEALH